MTRINIYLASTTAERNNDKAMLDEEVALFLLTGDYFTKQHNCGRCWNLKDPKCERCGGQRVVKHLLRKEGWNEY